MLKIALRLILSLVLLAGVGAAIVAHHGVESIHASLSEVAPSALVLAGTALLVSALLGAVRVKCVAADLGYELSWRDAFAALGLGQVGSAIFFSVAGQLVARSAYLSARGQPLSATMMMVGYERMLAALVSLALATAGAWYVFGQVGFQLEMGGADFLKLVVGITLAASAGAWLGWGSELLAPLQGLGRAQTAGRILLNLALSIAIQLSTMATYVVVAQALAPDIPLIKLAAASAVVMLAASVPISFGGWGIRELSAVLTLGAIGMSPAAALVTAVLIGPGSLLVVVLLAAIALVRGTAHLPPIQATSARIDHEAIVSTAVPPATATLVFFNVHIPTEAGGLNINLADPFALLGGALFVLSAIRQRQWPAWRVTGMNLHVGIATGALLVSLLVGAWRFGWSEWALVNKFAGWFVLLAYAATAAMIARGERGLELILLTFVAAGLAIVSLDLVLLTLRNGDVRVPSAMLGPFLTGFAQNRNAFAFQLVMVAAVACVLFNRRIAVAALAVTSVGLFYAASRAGWMGGVCLLAVALYRRALSVREAMGAACGATILLAVPWFPALLLGMWPPRGNVPIALFPQQTSLAQHIESFEGGVQLFLQHPLFGAGLGAFMQEHIAESGIPLVIHSTPIWLMGELGLVGLLAFLVPALRIFGREIKCSPPDLVSTLLVLILIVFGVMSLAHDFLYQRSLWLLLGAGLAHAALRREPRPKF